jgi:hypothetical protein
MLYAFDGDHSTMYNSSNLSCFVGVDIGEGLGVLLSRIRYFPNNNWQISANYIKGGAF